MAPKKYPIAPLLAAMKCGQGVAARRTKTSGREWKRYLAEGVTERVADRLATRAGFVVYEIWPEILDDAIASMERECAADGCDETFLPPLRVPYKVFCSRRCKTREWKRAEYQRDRDRQLARVAAYDQRNRESKRMYSAAWRRLKKAA